MGPIRNYAVLRVTRPKMTTDYVTVIPPYFADFGMKKSGLKNREIGGTAK